jgi:uncharacterized membrane protein YkvA (DUF1232 family)
MTESLLARLKLRARSLKNEIRAIAIAFRDPRTPWYAKLVAACVVAYALSPLDLIPDFIPVLGYLDDLILLPLGVALVVRLIPAEVLADAKQNLSVADNSGQKAGKLAAAAIVLVWLVLAAACFWIALRRF